MLTRAIVAAVLATAAAACGDPRRSMTEFAPPAGDPGRGRTAFVELRCTACHRVTGESLPEPVADPPIPVELGGRIAFAVTDGELADSIVHPSHRISYRAMAGVRSGRLSRMPAYADSMTVRELTDLVAYLQSRYEVIPPPTARY